MDLIMNCAQIRYPSLLLNYFLDKNRWLQTHRYLNDKAIGKKLPKTFIGKSLHPRTTLPPK